MRALIQRVSSASVTVDGAVVGAIGPGLLVLLGVTHDDDEAICDRLADKVAALRIFEDADGKMNDAARPDREILVVSQFTLYGDDPQGQPPLLHHRRPPRARRAALRALPRPPRRRRAGSSARTWRSRSSTTAR